MSQIFSFLRNPTVLVICFFLIVAVRFNRNSLVVNRPLNDAQFYIANVQLLRSEPLTYAFKGPFNERILVTTLAAVTPFEPLTAINVVNILCLLAAMYFLYLFLYGLSSFILLLLGFHFGPADITYAHRATRAIAS